MDKRLTRIARLGLSALGSAQCAGAYAVSRVLFHADHTGMPDDTAEQLWRKAVALADKGIGTESEQQRLLVFSLPSLSASLVVWCVLQLFRAPQGFSPGGAHSSKQKAQSQQKVRVKRQAAAQQLARRNQTDRQRGLQGATRTGGGGKQGKQRHRREPQEDSCMVPWPCLHLAL